MFDPRDLLTSDRELVPIFVRRCDSFPLAVVSGLHSWAHGAWRGPGEKMSPNRPRMDCEKNSRLEDGCEYLISLYNSEVMA